MTKQDTAILVVSFGTTHLDTLENCIWATEQDIAEHFPEYPVYRAFLSTIVMRRLQEKYGLHVDSVEEALERIRRDGYQKVVVQPTLVLGGIEYDLLREKMRKEKALSIAVGCPLLMDQKDGEVLAAVIQEEHPLKEQEALVLMGHGTEHEANAVYGQLQDIFRQQSYPCFVGTVEGIPSFEDAVGLLKASGVSCARLLPLMFVAGDHAKHDMAGSEDSLMTMVQEAGIQAIPVIRGLGESRSVRKLFVERAAEAMKAIV